MEPLDYVSKIMWLSNTNYKYLNIDAVFSDESGNFREPIVPRHGERVKIRIRVGRDNLNSVYLCYNYTYIRMYRIKQTRYFDYYEGSFACPDEKLRYYFLLDCGGRTYFYNRQGIQKSLNGDFNFAVIPDFETPDWAKGAVMYQIYVDRFYDGDKSNNVKTNEYEYLGNRARAVEDWTAPLENLDVCNFYGGDLQGVIDKLDYLESLGIDAIYFNPLFVSPSNHKYDIQDYDYIDPHYGVIVKDGGELLGDDDKNNENATMYMLRTTNKENLEASNALFARLVRLAHERNIRVIIDGVFNHCGAFNRWLDREGFYRKNGYPVGAYESEESEYHNYFKWYGGEWPNNENYDGWWGHSNHPKLNYEQSEKLKDYIMQIAAKWVSPPYCCDGWRLDVAADLGFSKEYNMRFWREFRRAVKSANPQAIILAEHYGDAGDWLNGDQWDTVMNYDAFMEPITWFLTGLEKHSEERDDGRYNDALGFESAMRYYTSRFSFQSQSVAMNELSNHDHSRFLTRTNRRVGRLHTAGAAAADEGVNYGIMKEAITYQMTWRGAPTIYYGDEVGLTGWTDPDNRRPFPWGRENEDILSFYKKLISIHKKYKCLAMGSLDYLYMNYGIICYGRWDENEQIAVILNNNTTEQAVNVQAWRMGCENGDGFVRLVVSDEKGWTDEPEYYTVENGSMDVIVPAFGSAVIAGKREFC